MRTWIARIAIAAAALALLCAGPVGAGAAGTQRVTVFAAASLKNVLEQAGKAWQAQGGGSAVFSFAGSSVLARQILQGAPADIYISASTQWMDHLQDRQAIDPDTRFDLAANDLVLIAHGAGRARLPGGKRFDIEAMLAGGRLAMALVDSVPAGIYGRQALEALGQWDRVEGLVAQTDNVRAALMLVARGEAQLGIVYATDAAEEPDVSVIAVFAQDTHDPIVYPAAATPGAPGQARDFLRYLRSDAGRRLMARHGFRPAG